MSAWLGRARPASESRPPPERPASRRVVPQWGFGSCNTCQTSIAAKGGWHWWTVFTQSTEGSVKFSRQHPGNGEYMFVLMKQADLKDVLAARTIPGTKKYYHGRFTGVVGQLQRRRYPCWCKFCLCMAPGCFIWVLLVTWNLW